MSGPGVSSGGGPAGRHLRRRDLEEMERAMVFGGERGGSVFKEEPKYETIYILEVSAF